MQIWGLFSGKTQETTIYFPFPEMESLLYLILFSKACAYSILQAAQKQGLSSYKHNSSCNIYTHATRQVKEVWCRMFSSCHLKGTTTKHLSKCQVQKRDRLIRVSGVSGFCGLFWSFSRDNVEDQSEKWNPYNVLMLSKKTVCSVSIQWIFVRQKSIEDPSKQETNLSLEPIFLIT